MKYRLVFWCVLPVCLLMLFFCGEGILHRSAQTKPLQTGSISVPYSETIQKWYTQLQVQLGNRQRNGVYIGETVSLCFAKIPFYRSSTTDCRLYQSLLRYLSNFYLCDCDTGCCFVLCRRFAGWNAFGTAKAANLSSFIMQLICISEKQMPIIF